MLDVDLAFRPVPAAVDAVGRVEPVRGYVTLRTFDYVAAMHLQRFDRHLAVNPADYQRFIASISAMFTSAGLTIYHEAAGATAAPTAAPQQGSSRIIWILLTLLVLIGLGLLVYTQVFMKP